jgi:hypothetical protein
MLFDVTLRGADPLTRKPVLTQIQIEAETGDDAVQAAKRPDCQIVGVHPSAEQPKPKEPARPTLSLKKG